MDNLPAILKREPEEVVEDGRKAATALMKIVNSKKKVVKIRGETYLEFEDWQMICEFDGRGYSIRTKEAILVEIDGIKGAKAIADLIDKDGKIIGGAEAYCMRDEENWQKKPWFQLASMAQTRAGAKALRNKFSFIAPLAGVKSTPAEEIESMSFDLKDMSTEPMRDEEQKGMETSPPMGDESQPPSHSSPPPEEEPQYQEKITDKQMSALYGISKGLGWAIEKVQDKAFKILGHPVGDLQSLTKRDASKLIEQLQKERAKGK